MLNTAQLDEDAEQGRQLIQEGFDLLGEKEGVVVFVEVVASTFAELAGSKAEALCACDQLHGLMKAYIEADFAKRYN